MHQAMQQLLSLMGCLCNLHTLYYAYSEVENIKSTEHICRDT
jgi:hypothetical protein